MAEGAYSKVILANGKSALTRIVATKLTKAAAVDAVASVNAEPGSEIFIQVQRISSGTTDVAYAWHGSTLVQIDKSTFTRHDTALAGDIGIGPGCTTGVQ